MGAAYSQEGFVGTIPLLPHAQKSFDQVFQAFRDEFTRQPPNHHHHHHHHHQRYRSQLHSSGRQSRSHPSDQYYQNDDQNITEKSSFITERQWQCQLCHLLNENDAQICAECGSNKVNVYVPLLDGTDKHEDHENRHCSSSKHLLSIPHR